MVIGLIGGVGSGKSAVTDILAREYGFRLLLTDDIAKKCEEPGGTGYVALTEEFGDKILTSGIGSAIDKVKFAGMIYSDENVQKRVNEIIHPIVWDIVENTIKDTKKSEGSDADIAVETALPCERFADMCDEVWFIYADEAVRIDRLAASRGYSVEKCISMIESQCSDEEFSAYSQYIIDNSGSLTETAGRVKELLCGS